MVSAPLGNFNLSRNLNVGIKAALGDYVMLTAADQLFSANLMEKVYLKVGPNRVVESTRGDLPVGFRLGDADTIIDRWPSLVAQSIPPQKFSPGTIICTTRQWLLDVHGLDETRCPYNYCDSDLLTRSQEAGLVPVEIGWGESFILHMAHPRNIPLYYIKSGMPDRSLPIVRNPNGWGK
jgi:glycosyltransferase involved in cell wall biosynthesis